MCRAVRQDHTHVQITIDTAYEELRSADQLVLRGFGITRIAVNQGAQSLERLTRAPFWRAYSISAARQARWQRGKPKLRDTCAWPQSEAGRQR
jgi:hypothetical protein